MQDSEFIKPNMEGDYGIFCFINGPRLPLNQSTSLKKCETSNSQNLVLQSLLNVNFFKYKPKVPRLMVPNLRFVDNSVIQGVKEFSKSQKSYYKSGINNYKAIQICNTKFLTFELQLYQFRDKDQSSYAKKKNKNTSLCRQFSKHIAHDKIK